MGKILLAVLTGLLYMTSAEAATVYYQPTPYPLKKASGSSMPQGIDVVHTWSGWFSSSFNKTLVQDNKLQIGGWGDTYASPIRFDLTGLPRTVSGARLYLYALPSGAAEPSQVAMFPITSDWSPATIGWNNFPSTANGLSWQVSPLTLVNTWRAYEITGWYNDWKSGVRPDKGLLIWPYNNDGTQRFDRFVSSRSTDKEKRPLLRLDFTPPVGMPNFKMPVPGGAEWLLTNEIGGYECMGATPLPDTAHQGNSYFSIDISPSNVKDVGGSYTGNIPILAAADGTVVYAETNQYVPNGYHIVLNHSGSSSTTSGYTTKSLHLKDRPRRSNGVALAVGNTVLRGDQVGIMGTTGVLSDGTPTSTGVHLHFGVYYNGSGASSVSQLTYAVMDGLHMKSYQTECSVNSSGVPTVRTQFYRSSNRVY